MFLGCKLGHYILGCLALLGFGIWSDSTVVLKKYEVVLSGLGVRDPSWETWQGEWTELPSTCFSAFAQLISIDQLLHFTKVFCNRFVHDCLKPVNSVNLIYFKCMSYVRIVPITMWLWQYHDNLHSSCAVKDTRFVWLVGKPSKDSVLSITFTDMFLSMLQIDKNLLMVLKDLDPVQLPIKKKHIRPTNHVRLLTVSTSFLTK